MCIVTLTGYFVSRWQSSLEHLASSRQFAVISGPDYQRVIGKTNDYMLEFMSFTYNGYDTDILIDYILNKKRCLEQLKTLMHDCEIRVLFSFDIGGEIDAEMDPIPGFSFTRVYLQLCKEIEASIDVKICSIPVNAEGGRTHSGVYYYISSDMELNVSALNSVSGTMPTRTLKKGEIINVVPSKRYSWNIEMDYENEMPCVPMKRIMSTIKNPKELGAYCVGRCLNSHMDLTLYGIYDSVVSFSIDYDFICFCADLQLDRLDIDIMG